MLYDKAIACGDVILVLGEDGLGEPLSSTTKPKSTGLNPCCSGRWSRRICHEEIWRYQIPVLILVLVEDGLGELSFKHILNYSRQVLILVVVEDGLGGHEQRRI